MNLLGLATSTYDTSTSSRFPPIGLTVEDRLFSSGYLSLRDVSCIASDDVAYLDGRLPSYYLKQLAQEIAARVDGVRVVINKIEVKAAGTQAP